VLTGPIKFVVVEGTRLSVFERTADIPFFTAAGKAIARILEKDTNALNTVFQFFILLFCTTTKNAHLINR
jgi:hypothetical protein